MTCYMASPFFPLCKLVLRFHQDWQNNLSPFKTMPTAHESTSASLPSKLGMPDHFIEPTPCDNNHLVHPDTSQKYLVSSSSLENLPENTVGPLNPHELSKLDVNTKAGVSALRSPLPSAPKTKPRQTKTRDSSSELNAEENIRVFKSDDYPESRENDPGLYMCLPELSTSSSPELEEAAHALKSEPPAVGDISDCDFLAVMASEISTAACTAAFLQYKANNPQLDFGSVEGEPTGAWLEAQKLIKQRIAAAQRKAVHKVTARIKSDDQYEKDGRTTVEGHGGQVQPWMSSIVEEAVNAAAMNAFIEVDQVIMIVERPSAYPLLSFVQSGLRSVRFEHSGLQSCLCKEEEAMHVILEDALYGAHYRLPFKVLLEGHDLERAHVEMENYMVDVGYDALGEIADEGDDSHLCASGHDVRHMKQWMTWHVGFRCDEAARKAAIILRKACCSNDEGDRKPVREGTIKAELKHSEDRGDDPMSCLGPMPYPGCRCMLWGAESIMNVTFQNAWHAVEDLPIDQYEAFGLRMLRNAEEAKSNALQTIGKIVAEMGVSGPGEESLTKDHFPMWQQDLVRQALNHAARRQVAATKSQNGFVDTAGEYETYADEVAGLEYLYSDC